MAGNIADFFGQHLREPARVLYRLCDIEGFVSWEGNRYSLPYDYVTDILPVRITQREIFVYAADLSLISHHELRPKGRGDDAELPGHHPRATRGTDLGQLRRAFEDMGPPAQAFLAGLERARARSAGYHARHVLTLRQRYHTADLVKALDHAQRFGAFEHTAVERILLSRATPRRLDEYVTERHLKSLLDESGPETHDLSEYDALPCWNGSSPREGDRPCPPAAEARPPSNAPPVAKQMERIEKPRIAVLGLNPHAGEHGLIGTDERETIVPAIEALKSKGIDCEGPFPADGFFGSRSFKRYDAIMAMYHDQGLIPIKMSSFGDAVNFSAGLTIIRTSPGHGTAYDIAGKGKATIASMVQAIMLAVQFAKVSP